MSTNASNTIPASITDRMIARRVSKGHREDESRALLEELTAALTGNNLASALFYQGFATPTKADWYATAVAR